MLSSSIHQGCPFLVPTLYQRHNLAELLRIHLKKWQTLNVNYKGSLSSLNIFRSFFYQLLKLIFLTARVIIIFYFMRSSQIQLFHIFTHSKIFVYTSTCFNVWRSWQNLKSDLSHCQFHLTIYFNFSHQSLWLTIFHTNSTPNRPQHNAEDSGICFQSSKEILNNCIRR